MSKQCVNLVGENNHFDRYKELPRKAKIILFVAKHITSNEDCTVCKFSDGGKRKALICSSTVLAKIANTSKRKLHLLITALVDSKMIHYWSKNISKSYYFNYIALSKPINFPFTKVNLRRLTRLKNRCIEKIGLDLKNKLRLDRTAVDIAALLSKLSLPAVKPINPIRVKLSKIRVRLGNLHRRAEKLLEKIKFRIELRTTIIECTCW